MPESPDWTVTDHYTPPAVKERCCVCAGTGYLWPVGKSLASLRACWPCRGRGYIVVEGYADEPVLHFNAQPYTGDILGRGSEP
ncbi:MAG: hypothetical protein IT518_20645 [Burkholderiales bacterium]|nr:hypothetical protein [Burkholderiales bacterium]